MKRDLDLIRLLLIKQEGEEKGDLSQYTEDQLKYHQALLINAHFAEGKTHYSSRGGGLSDEIPDRVDIMRLIWEGHEFLDASRDESRWKKAKKLVADKAGAISLEVIKQVLIQLMKDAVFSP